MCNNLILTHLTTSMHVLLSLNYHKADIVWRQVSGEQRKDIVTNAFSTKWWLDGLFT